MKKITYLCGGINGLSDSAAIDWRERAKQSLKTDTLDPMRRDYRGIEEANYKEIVRGDLVDILNSDFILVNATRPSFGTAMEIVYAAQFGRTVVSFIGEGRTSPWLKYHSTAIFRTLEEAIKYINDQAE
jgi:nucleoside 2-deoxyribosyltransferase